jgi:chromosomal replication initiation ATPase DnaA
MSSLTQGARGGDFATSRRGGIAEDMAFIMTRHQQGVPISAIARMTGRSEADVRRAVGATKPRKATPKPSPTLGRTRTRAQRVDAARGIPPAALCIVAGIAAEYGFSAEDVRFSRKRKVTAARRDAYHALYATGRYSYPQIADWFGLKSHHAVREGALKHAALLADQLREAA